jgi:membrane protein insertase, YidC/Oxa1 family, C-terminal domain
MEWLNIVEKPMGSFLYFIYNTVAFHNYGIAIIFFTLIVRACILPLTIKQYKSTANMQKIQPFIDEINKKYKNDKEKLNQEMMKIYSEHKVNPAGGCLPLLIQMPIILSLYWVISRPLYYMLGKSNDVITQLLTFVPAEFAKVTSNKELVIINYFSTNKDKLAMVTDLLKPEEVLNLHFFGLNLGLMPTFDTAKAAILGYQFFGLLLIPILAALTTYLSFKMSMAAQPQGQNNQMAASMNSSMSFVMPLMTGFFAFSVPAGLGLYWIVGNLIQMLQQLYLNKYVLNHKKAEPVAAAAVGGSKETAAIETRKETNEVKKIQNRKSSKKK